MLVLFFPNYQEIYKKYKKNDRLNVPPRQHLLAETILEVDDRKNIFSRKVHQIDRKKKTQIIV